MAYIIDLIISDARPDGVAKPEEVEDVLNRFEANQCNDVHQEIRQFTREMGVLKAAVGKDVVFEKIVNLIDHYRANRRADASVVAFSFFNRVDHCEAQAVT